MRKHLLKRIGAAIIGLGLAAALAPAAWADRLLDSFDIPLPDGFELDPEQMLWFDSPAGRVLEVVAAGPAPPGRVAAYYQASLPMLGWSAQALDKDDQSTTLRFRREGERLDLHILGVADATRLRLTLAPEP
ncbi:MAG: hypothetical protein Tsb0016_19340 [Sphingomonadales bacterium]